MELKGFARLGIAILLSVVLLIVIIILISQRAAKEEKILAPERVVVPRPPFEPKRKAVRIEDIEFEEMEPAAPSMEAALPDEVEEEGVAPLEEVSLSELPLDEIPALPEPTEEAEVAEERPRKMKEPIVPGYDIHPGPEDLRGLKESGAIIY